MNGLRGIAGAAALVAAGFLVPDPGPDVPRSEPLAAALAPLGPFKSLASSLLWAQMLTAQMEAEGQRTAALGRALLELHPDLEIAREYVANQLVVTEAPRAPDVARHDVLVTSGLALLEQGLQLRDSARLHGALGRLLVAQRKSDPAFRLPAEAWLGDDLEVVAIDHLQRSELFDSDRLALGGLLLERGEQEIRDDDVWAARRDWQAARAALAPLHQSEAPLIDQRLQGLAHDLFEHGVNPASTGPLPEGR
ncbi:MAG TPA: hypothetical protein VFY71_11715 [Planctomycetota bacterium]|nr:hypothetical protein [Planctomycetota bacterium]